MAIQWGPSMKKNPERLEWQQNYLVIPSNLNLSSSSSPLNGFLMISISLCDGFSG
jgi:hypothetical protein